MSTQNNSNNNNTNENPKIGAGVLLRTLKKGDGILAKDGDFCLVHYEGFLEDGTQFDNSRKRKMPIRVELGAGQVIEGWEAALRHMSKSTIAEVTIPYLYAYGEMGYPPRIPPRSTLIFEMELLDITPKEK